MKIGLSYSRCVRDIVDGVVDIKDVLVIVARTDFDPRNDEQWAGIWAGYGGGNGMQSMRGFLSGSNPEWEGYDVEDEAKFREVSIELWDSGKFHQPRKFGAHPRRLPHIWLETILPSEDLDTNPSIKAAWDKFQMLAGLSDVQLDNDHRA
jgi:hypothetical protein